MGFHTLLMMSLFYITVLELRFVCFCYIASLFIPLHHCLLLYIIVCNNLGSLELNLCLTPYR